MPRAFAEIPATALELPKAIPYPTAQKIRTEIPRSTRFLIATLILFLLRVNPDFRHINPGCMTKTRKVLNINQRELESIGIADLKTKIK